MQPRFARATRSTIAMGLFAALTAVTALGAERGLPAADAPDEPILVAADGGHATDHVLVQLRTGVALVAGKDGRQQLRDASRARTTRDAATAMREAGVVRFEPVWVEAPRDAATARALGLDRWYRAVLADGGDAVASTARLRRARTVFERAELDHEGGLAEIPNDPNFGLQYALRNVGQVVGGLPGIAGADVSATAAWDITHGNDLVIAVLDSGIDPHPELAGRILPGINVPDGNTVTVDECNHGTHVAGIIAAAGNNGSGMAGLAWNARLLPVVVVNGCTGFEANVASGLIWAVDNGARIVNMSLQFYAFNPIFEQAVQYAHAQGALMVAASGNNGNTNVAAPARWNQTIAVAATDNRDERATFSNFGPEIDLAAPGVSVWSLSGQTSYTYKSGTSMAAPHVSGAAALLWAYDPSLTRDQVRAFLQLGAQDLGDPGTDILFGSGRLDIAASLALVPPPYAPEDLDRDGVVNAQDLAILLDSWGACADCDSCAADFDGDCMVGATDLGRLLSAW